MSNNLVIIRLRIRGVGMQFAGDYLVHSANADPRALEEIMVDMSQPRHRTAEGVNPVTILLDAAGYGALGAGLGSLAGLSIDELSARKAAAEDLARRTGNSRVGSQWVQAADPGAIVARTRGIRPISRNIITGATGGALGSALGTLMGHQRNQAAIY